MMIMFIVIRYSLTLHGALCRCEYKETFLADKHEIEGEISQLLLVYRLPFKSKK